MLGEPRVDRSNHYFLLVWRQEIRPNPCPSFNAQAWIANSQSYHTSAPKRHGRSQDSKPIDADISKKLGKRLARGTVMPRNTDPTAASSPPLYCREQPPRGQR